MKLGWNVIGIFILSLAARTSVAAFGEPEIQAARITAEQLTQWVQGLKQVPAPIGIFATRTSPPLEPDFGNALEGEFTRMAKSAGEIRLVTCFDCKAPQLKVAEDRIVITKGAPDLGTLQALGKKVGAASFLILESHQTKFRIHTQATLYDTGTGEVIASETFSIPSLSMFDNALQLTFSVGPSYVLNKGQASSEQAFPPLTINLMFLEELGNMKGGIKFSSVSASQRSPLTLIMPTFSPRMGFTGSSLYVLTPVSVGLGFAGKNFGLGLGAALDVFLGSFTNIGIEVAGVVPVNKIDDSGRDPIKAHVSLHIGLSFGR